MSDTPPSRPSKPEDKRGFLQKLAEMLHPGPDSKDELIETLVEAQDNDVIGAQSREMLEGVIRMAELAAASRGEVMLFALPDVIILLLVRLATYQVTDDHKRAMRQQMPISPKLSTTLQKRSQRWTCVLLTVYCSNTYSKKPPNS